MLARFNAPPGGTRWYYRSLADVFLARLPGPLAAELDAVVIQMEALMEDG